MTLKFIKICMCIDDLICSMNIDTKFQLFSLFQNYAIFSRLKNEKSQNSPKHYKHYNNFQINVDIDIIKIIIN